MLALALALVLPLSPQLEQWRSQIAAAGSFAVHVLALSPAAGQDRIPLPGDAPHPAILARFTDNPNFAAQFRAAQALSVHTEGPGGRLSYILLNPALAPEGEAREAVLAHELGHLWLKANRYPAPVYSGAESGCLAIHAGDAVQHVLIRAEMERRSLPWRRPWIESLEQALNAMQAEFSKPRTTPGRCQALALAALWADAALGLDETAWPRLPDFFRAIRTRFPQIAPAAEEITAHLRPLDLASHEVHRQALAFVFNRLKSLALSLPRG